MLLSWGGISGRRYGLEKHPRVLVLFSKFAKMRLATGASICHMKRIRRPWGLRPSHTVGLTFYRVNFIYLGAFSLVTVRFHSTVNLYNLELLALANPLESGNFFESSVKRRGLDEFFGPGGFLSTGEDLVGSYEDLEDLHLDDSSNFSARKAAKDSSLNSPKKNEKPMVIHRSWFYHGVIICHFSHFSCRKISNRFQKSSIVGHSTEIKLEHLQLAEEEEKTLILMEHKVRLQLGEFHKNLEMGSRRIAQENGIGIQNLIGKEFYFSERNCIIFICLRRTWFNRSFDERRTFKDDYSYGPGYNKHDSNKGHNRHNWGQNTSNNARYSLTNQRHNNRMRESEGGEVAPRFKKNNFGQSSHPFGANFEVSNNGSSSNHCEVISKDMEVSRLSFPYLGTLLTR